ncbi:MAG: hypothetical protein IJM30_01075, partial [Thermoguttaceae bacterium]|nr:hypothetical protein [Thermoguttaceae bacterium]
LTSWTVTGLSAKHFYCHNNGALASFSATNCSVQYNFEIYENPVLTAIDLSGAQSLTNIWVYDNASLTDLDLDNASANDVHVYANDDLTSWTVTGLSAKHFYCHNNGALASFSATNCSVQYNFEIYENPSLTTLDLSSNPSQTSFVVHDNAVKTLSVVDCAGLRYLYCAEDSLETIYTSNDCGFELRVAESDAWDSLAILDENGEKIEISDEGSYLSFQPGLVGSERITMEFYVEGSDVSVRTATIFVENVQLATPSIAVSGNARGQVTFKVYAVTGAEKYVVEYSTDPQFATSASFTIAPSSPKESYSRTISNLTIGTWYYVRVKATAPSTERPDSSYATAKAYTGGSMAMPSVSASAVKNAIVLNIKAGKIDEAVGIPSGYVVEYSENEDFSNAKTRNVSQGYNADGSLKPCKPTISGLTFGTRYYFRVKAISSTAGDSGWNVLDYAAGQLATPSFFASKIGTDFINVRCYNSASASGFEVMYSTSSDFSNVHFAQGPASGVVAITGLSANVKYYFKVRALGNNETRVDSTWSKIVNNATTKPAATSSALLDDELESFEESLATNGSGSFAQPRGKVNHSSGADNFFDEDGDEFWTFLAQSLTK